MEQRVDPTKVRFSDAPWANSLRGRSIMVVGSGGIGSWVTLCLARIGCRVYLYDLDKVEIHNLGGQMLRADSVGASKTDVVSTLCYELCGAETEVIGVEGMFDKTSPVSPIMIAAVDNMATRKLMFEMWLDMYKDIDKVLFIDGRLLAEDYQVYVVTPQRADLYRETLFDDSEVAKENCGLKSTTHCSLGIASDIIGALTNWVANTVSHDEGKTEVRDVPFSIVKSIPNFLYDLTFKDDNRGKKEEGVNNQGVLSTSA